MQVTVKENPFCPEGKSDEISEYLPVATVLYTAEELTTIKRDAERYRKLQLWMASNVKEGWQEVEKLGGICAWMSCADMDQALDALPDCNVGLCEKQPK